jgi:hypothetical protein
MKPTHSLNARKEKGAPAFKTNAPKAKRANAIAAQHVAKEPDGNRNVRPISGTSGPMLAEEPTGYANETIGFARLRLA